MTYIVGRMAVPGLTRDLLSDLQEVPGQARDSSERTP